MDSLLVQSDGGFGLPLRGVWLKKAIIPIIGLLLVASILHIISAGVMLGSASSYDDFEKQYNAPYEVDQGIPLFAAVVTAIGSVITGAVLFFVKRSVFAHRSVHFLMLGITCLNFFVVGISIYLNVEENSTQGGDEVMRAIEYHVAILCGILGLLYALLAPTDILTFHSPVDGTSLRKNFGLFSVLLLIPVAILSFFLVAVDRSGRQPHWALAYMNAYVVLSGVLSLLVGIMYSIGHCAPLPKLRPFYFLLSLSPMLFSSLALGSNYLYISGYLFSFTGEEGNMFAWGRIAAVCLIVSIVLNVFHLVSSPISFRWIDTTAAAGYLAATDGDHDEIGEVNDLHVQQLDEDEEGMQQYKDDGVEEEEGEYDEEEEDEDEGEGVPEETEEKEEKRDERDQLSSSSLSS
eukprot:TRINITY_DN1389_c0_g1_i1.p1 TRINITY_DN1389_c0_g1~~TRINITY_DN1389_c0_g1_i1.p1  ORF type:complete len:405 (-),score=75.21 TRINITY_DN1389_c0_g1_i1:16-1230(-)